MYYSQTNNISSSQKDELEFINNCKKKFSGYKQILKNNPEISDTQSVRAEQTENMLDKKKARLENGFQNNDLKITLIDHKMTKTETVGESDSPTDSEGIRMKIKKY